MIDALHVLSVEPSVDYDAAVQCCGTKTAILKRSSW